MSEELELEVSLKLKLLLLFSTSLCTSFCFLYRQHVMNWSVANNLALPKEKKGVRREKEGRMEGRKAERKRGREEGRDRWTEGGKKEGGSEFPPDSEWTTHWQNPMDEDKTSLNWFQNYFSLIVISFVPPLIFHISKTLLLSLKHSKNEK